jgi:hypothetical protein
MAAAVGGIATAKHLFAPATQVAYFHKYQLHDNVLSSRLESNKRNLHMKNKNMPRPFKTSTPSVSATNCNHMSVALLAPAPAGVF